jgi:large subunit ribosomal protein L6
MSRIANNPVAVPSGVEVSINGNAVNVKGPNGDMSFDMHDTVEIIREDDNLKFSARDKSKSSNAMAGTMRSVVNNMVVGVSKGFEKKLLLVGVGYRAQAQGKVLNLTLGHSHPINYEVPEGITVETPSQTEVVVKGCDKQKVGQVSAEIRAFRPPEPYKGKGVKYSDETIIRKEAKKK